MNSFIAIDNVSFRYAGAAKQALLGISLDVEVGDTLVLLGASGAGKSTLIKLLSAVLPSDQLGTEVSGNILIDGVAPEEFLRTRRIGVMFQDPTLLDHLTVVENIGLPIYFETNRDQRVDELVKRVGLAEYSAFYPKQLSGGMRTRVALARAFVTEPKLLLLDEPFASLDSGWRHELYSLLTKLKNEFRTTIFMITHSIEEATTVADQIVVLAQNGSLERTYSKKLQSWESIEDLRISLLRSILKTHPANSIVTTR